MSNYFIRKESTPPNIAACWADPTKINKKIGWRAEKNITEALRDAWKWEKNL